MKEVTRECGPDVGNSPTVREGLLLTAAQS